MNGWLVSLSALAQVNIVSHFNDVVSSLGEGNAPYSSTLAWKIPWMEEPGRLQSMGLLRVGHD